jgi:hydroxyethylthiazole kinase-like uncharacterized protein yjeF
MKVATAAEMRELDRRTIEEYGLPGIALMENAGREVARKVAEILGEVAGRKVCIFAGKGNNGGDGFVAARHLAAGGAAVTVFLAGSPEGVGGDARINLDVIAGSGADICQISGQRDLDRAALAATLADCLVDALLGTGFRGEVGGDLAEMVKILNTAGKPVVAVDIPTGIDADTGQVCGVAVRASHTVTFAFPKPGLLLQPGADYAGELTVAGIGFPAKLLAEAALPQSAITADYARALLPVRRPWAHKGTSGRVVVVAGAPGLTGAAALSATAAMRAGAGLVTLAVAESLNPIMAVKLTEVMTRPLPEAAGGCLGLAAVPVVGELAATADVLAIGPGLGRDSETAEAVRKIVAGVNCPLVIDADGLNSLAGYTDILLDAAALPVLTPHPGELSRLTGLPVATINADRLAAAREAAARFGAIVVLKGAGTVVAYPDGEAFINTTGNAGLATGGTGDVLTGVIAAFIAQGLTSHDAAVAGVYIHGLAGELASGTRIVGLAAGDLLPALPAAIARGRGDAG